MTRPEAIHLVDAMSPSPISIDINASISDAREMMELHDIHHLPVVENENVESVISKRDILHYSQPGHKTDSGDELSVADICPSRAYIADINDPLDRVVGIMAEKHITAVVVLEEGEVCGIFTGTDACRVLAKVLTDH